MKDNFKIAWRNLWRNKRRTIITAASIFFAVFFAAFMRSYQLGTYDRMISAAIESYSGHLQIQHYDYLHDRQIDNSFIFDDSIERMVKNTRNVISVAPHIESFALASSGSRTKGVAILGIDPEKERGFSNPENRLVRYRITEDAIERMKESNLFPESVLRKITENKGRAYSSRARLELETGLTGNEAQKLIPEIMRFCEVNNGYLMKDDNGVLISDRLASFLRAGIGDTIILIGQGYQGSSAAGLFPVRGIVKLPSPELDNKLIMMTIVAAQNFLDCPGRITSLSVNLRSKSPGVINATLKDLNTSLHESGTVARTWYELNPVLYQQIQGDSQSGMVMLGVLYFIIFFGIFGTVLMMVAERKREFGVLVSIGMQKTKLKRIISLEMLMLGIIGLAGGLAAAAPLIIYFHYSPIVLRGDLGKMMEDFGWDPVMPTAWFGPYYFWQALIVALMILLATLYPLRKITRLKEIEALRS